MSMMQIKLINNKKVLLRERKRHTARCVANTRYVVVTGYPPRGGTRSGTPPRGVSGQVPPGSGYPPGGVPSQVPPGGVPGQVPPRGGPGTPQGYPVRYPPGGTRSGTPPGEGTRTPPPPPVDRQTPVKTVPSRRTTYAGGN